MEKFRIDGVKEAVTEWGKLNTQFKTSVSDLLKIVEVSQKASAQFKQIGTIKGFSSFSKSSVTNIKNLDKSTQGLTASQKALENAAKRLQVAQSQEAKEIAEVRQKTLELNKVNKLTARSSLGLVGAYEKLSQQLIRQRTAAKNAAVAFGTNSKVFKSLARDVRRTDKQLKAIDKTLGQSQRNVGNYSSALAGVGRNLLGALGVVGGITAFVRVLRTSFSTIRDFELQIATLGGISRASKEDLELLSDEALRLGASTQFTAGQVAELQTEFARLGFDPQQIISLSEATLDAATALDAGLGDTAKLVGSTLKAFNLDISESQRVVDTLAGATQRSALDFNKLQTALGVVSPVAKNAGVSLEETASSLGVLVDRGVDASTAATGLRNVFLEVAKRGITVEDAFNQITSASDKNAKALELFGKRGATVGTILAENAVQATQLAQDLTLAGGSAQELADKRLNTLDGSLKLLNSAWEGFILSLNESSGASSDLSKFIRFLAENLEEIFITIRNVAIVWGVYRLAIFAANKAQLLFAASQKAVRIGSLLLNGGLKKVITTFRTLNAVSKANVFGAVAAAVTALIIVFRQFSKEVDTAKKIQENFNDVNETAQKAIRKERVELTSLIKVARDETVSKEQRLKAIEQINKISPEYLGNITLENINTDESTAAIGRYISALNKKAVAQAISNKIQKLNDELLDRETSSLEENLSQIERVQRFLTAGFSLEEANRKAIEQATKNRDNETDSIKEQIEALEDLFKEKIKSGEIDIDDIFGNTEAIGKNTKERNKAIKAIKGSIGFLEKQISSLVAEQKALATNSREWGAYNKQIEDAKKNLADLKREFEGIDLSELNIGSTEEAFKRLNDIISKTNEQELEGFDYDKAKQELKDFGEQVKAAKEAEVEIYKETTKAKQRLESQLSDSIIDITNSIFDSKIQRYEQDIQENNDYYASLLDNESLNEEQRDQLEAERDAKNAEIEKKKRETERQAAVFNKVAALAEVAIDTVKQVAKIKLQASLLAANPLTAPLAAQALAQIPLAIATGALAAASIAAQPLPGFYTGVEDSSYEGWAKTSERGAEIHTDKLGNIKSFGSKYGTQLSYIEKGDTIYTSEKTKEILSGNILDSAMLNGVYPKLDAPKKQVVYTGITEQEMENVLSKTIAKQPKHMTILDKSGMRQYVKKGSTLVKLRNNPYGL